MSWACVRAYLGLWSDTTINPHKKANLNIHSCVNFLPAGSTWFRRPSTHKCTIRSLHLFVNKQIQYMRNV